MKLCYNIYGRKGRGSLEILVSQVLGAGTQGAGSQVVKAGS